MSIQQLGDQLHKILAASSRQSEHECIVDILNKRSRSQEETKMLFNKIKSFTFFQNFFSHYIQDMDMQSILTICQGFAYEKVPANRTVFSQKDASNDKFYVILSGEVAVCIKNENDPISTDKEKRSASPVYRRQKKMSTYSARQAETTLVRRRSKRLSSQPLINTSNDSIDSDAPLKLSPNSRTSIPKKSIFGRREARDSESEVPPARHLTLNINSPSPSIKRVEHSPEPHDESRLLPSVLKIGKRFSFIDHNNHKKVNIVVDQIANIRAVRNKSIEPNSINSNINSDSLQYLDQKDHDHPDNYEEKHGGSVKIEDNDYFTDDDEVPKSDFEVMVSILGKIVRYLREGEGFGEIALKRNIPRTASILCKTDCEFLTLSKEQYELGFGKMQREKEEFIYSIFPMLKTTTFSIQALNSLLYSFKTERYPRGHYLITEGKINSAKDNKFYIIQQGECLIEKQIFKDDNEPLNSNKKPMGCVHRATITMSGKGVIVGEEILETKNEYKYSVKVSSDILVVQGINLKDFKNKFPREAWQYVQDLYEQKKIYREAVYEQLKKDNEQKLAQFKAENKYALQNREIKEYVIKSALNGFNRRLPNKIAEDNNGLVEALVSPKKSRLEYLAREGSYMFNESDKGKLEIKTARSEDVFGKEKDEKELYSWFGKLTNRKQNKILAKMEFLSRIPNKELGGGKTTEEDSLFQHPQKKEKLPNKLKMVSPRLTRKQFKEPEPLNENVDTFIPQLPQRKSSTQHYPLKINNYGEKVPFQSARNESEYDLLQEVGARRKTLNSLRFKPSEMLLLNQQFSSPPQQVQSARSSESASHSRRISHSEFKSLYCQTLVKGTAHIKGLSMTASTSGSMQKVATEAHLPQQKLVIKKSDSFRKNLLLTKFNTEPDTAESKNNSFNSKSSSRRGSGSAEESSNESKSHTKSTFSPSYTDKDFVMTTSSSKSIKRRSAFANDTATEKQDFGTFPATSRQKSPSKINSDAAETRLHQVQEWRKKVFKKASKVTPN